ncbi:MAG: hypothetical protein P8104_08245 [Gammaproteobacteria bacterium]
MRILKIPSDSEKDRKIGKVDFVLGQIKQNEIIDFAALLTALAPNNHAYLWLTAANATSADSVVTIT